MVALMRRHVRPWMAGVVSWLLPLSAWACPLCGEALFGVGDATARRGLFYGYLVSIVILLGVPALLIGGLVLLIRRASRQAKRS